MGSDGVCMTDPLNENPPVGNVEQTPPNRTDPEKDSGSNPLEARVKALEDRILAEPPSGDAEKQQSEEQEPIDEAEKQEPRHREYQGPIERIPLRRHAAFWRPFNRN